MNDIREKIRIAVRERSIMRYARGKLDIDGTYSYGFAISSSQHWLLTHYVADHLRLDGYDAVRIGDITDCDMDFDSSSFLRQCIEIKGQSASAPKGIRLDDTRSLLESIVDHYPLVLVHRERVSPNECELGALKMVSDETYALRWMTTTARWGDDYEVYRFDDVTRVTFGSEYETTLAVLAGLIESPWK